ncbi:BPSS1780 family membrane protein [Xenorhabdus bharatensis]|uniref:BPSS1780 family membrane protein n=1 Tax=Xenorhabdus bharatensis TaxID=3136256 RepID=UPI0030F3C5BE
MDKQDINLNSENENISLVKEKEVFIREAQSVGAGAAITWIGDAWRIFKEKPSRWILITFIYLIIFSILMYIPFVNLLLSLVNFILIAGINAAAEKQRTTGDLRIGILFYGFKEKLGPLIAIGVFYVCIYALSVGIAVLIGGDNMLNLLLFPQYVNILTYSLSVSMWWALFVFLILILITQASTYFAPALIIINNVRLSEALLMSLKAVKKNLVGGFLFFVLMGVIIFISALPLFLGLIITFPMYIITYYTMYRSIFYLSEYPRAP